MSIVHRGTAESQIKEQSDRRAANSIRGRSKNAGIDFDTIRMVAGQYALAICKRILPGGKVINNEYVVKNPKRQDRTEGSFKINVRSGRWSDFATGDAGGDLIALVAWRYDLSQLEAAKHLASFLSLEARGQR